MALIGKIRKNFWMVLILLAMALASFVLTDLLGSRQGGSGSLFSDTSTTIGKIAGKKIDYRDFQRTEENLYKGSPDFYGRKNMLWTYLVEKAIVEDQVDGLGLGVSKDELLELQFGNNLSSVIQNNFSNRQTGQVDRQSLMSIKQQIESGDVSNNPGLVAFWKEQEEQVIKTSLQDKINNILTKSIFIPKWQVETTNVLNNEKINFEFVRVGYDNKKVPEITLTDEDYQNFLKKNPNKYKVDAESRMVDYVIFSVSPTLEDSLKLKADLIALKAGMRTAENDSLFSTTNGGGLMRAYTKYNDLPAALKDSVASMSLGSVVGPYVDNQTYNIAKLINKKVVADSVKARHILKKASQPADFITARRSIDSLKNLLVTRRASFDSLAMKNSEDPGSGAQGGDLGTFGEGAMVKSFNDVCFHTGKPGNYYVVSSEFGVHLIEILNQKFVDKAPKYMLAIIPSAIIPSSDTEEKVMGKVNNLLLGIKTTDDLKKAAEKDPEIKIVTSSPLAANDYAIQGLQGDESRAIIKWAFESDVKDVSPKVFSYKDESNSYTQSYVIAGLNSINKPGLMSIAEAKIKYEMQVKNAKKAEKIKEMIKSNDLNALATEFDTKIDTAINTSFSSGGIEKIRSAEPKVVAKAYALGAGKISGPIEGNSGVFVIKVNGITPVVPENSNLEMIKSSILNSAKSAAQYRVWEAMKKKYKPVDNRSKFF